MNHPRITIAIDGYSSCGKSTMAKELARRIGYIYIDSGAMYRAVTLYCLENNLIINNIVQREALAQVMNNIKITFATNPNTNKQETYLNGICVEKEIRTMRVSDCVSLVSQIDFVREALVAQQRAMGNNKGIVMDGRDIGTVVFPKAELKLFLTASPEVRAERRYQELKAKGEEPVFDEVLADVNDRDYRDTHRVESPLKQAEDAVVVDNSNMTREEQMQHIIGVFRERCATV